jgi:hypothetical protein
MWEAIRRKSAFRPAPSKKARLYAKKKKKNPKRKGSSGKAPAEALSSNPRIVHRETESC